MVQATPAYSRFHNLSNEALADAIGQADAVLKGAEAEYKALKDEFKSRGLLIAAGEHFSITRSDQVSSRLDVDGRVSNVRTFHRESDMGRTHRALSPDNGSAATQSATALQRMPDGSRGRSDCGEGQARTCHHALGIGALVVGLVMRYSLGHPAHASDRAERSTCRGCRRE